MHAFLCLYVVLFVYLPTVYDMMIRTHIPFKMSRNVENFETEDLKQYNLIYVHSKDI